MGARLPGRTHTLLHETTHQPCSTRAAEIAPRRRTYFVTVQCALQLFKRTSATIINSSMFYFTTTAVAIVRRNRPSAAGLTTGTQGAYSARAPWVC